MTPSFPATSGSPRPPATASQCCCTTFARPAHRRMSAWQAKSSVVNTMPSEPHDAPRPDLPGRRREMRSKETGPRLGRGLAALLGDIAVQPPSPGSVRQLAVDLLEPNPYQPRSTIDTAPLEELTQSI